MKINDDNILRLAKYIKGSPKTHNSEYESVRPILKKFKDFKSELVSEGLIKKEKLDSYIYKENGHFYEIINDNESVCIDAELPFEVPDNWCWVRLSSISLNFDNKRTPLSVKKRKGQEKVYPYYGSSGEIDKIESYVFNGQYLLMVEDSGVLKTNKTVCVVVDGKFSTNNHVHVLKVDENIADYVCHYLNSLDYEGLNLLTGAVVPKINQKNLKNILVPLPPLEEQVEILDMIYCLSYYYRRFRKYESKLLSIEKEFTKDFRTSVLHDAIFGELSTHDLGDDSAFNMVNFYEGNNDNFSYSYIRKVDGSYFEYKDGEEYCIDDFIPFDIPDNWLWVRMENLVQVVGGTHESLNYVGEGYPVITSKNLRDEKIDWGDVKYISEEDYQRLHSKTPIDEGDILFGIVGNIGNSVMVLDRTDFCIKNVAVLKPYIEGMDLSYLYTILRYVEIQIKENAVGVAQPFVSLEFLRNFLVPLPPFNEQVDICEKVDELKIQLQNIIDAVDCDL